MCLKKMLITKQPVFLSIVVFSMWYNFFCCVVAVHEYIRSLVGCDALVDRLSLDSNKVSVLNNSDALAHGKASMPVWPDC